MRPLQAIKSHTVSFSIVTAFAVASTGWLIGIGKPELVPQLWTSILGLALAYLACVFTSERFRLDLLEKRFSIYENTLNFCSVVSSHGSLNATEKNRDEIAWGIRAAHESFRGIGFHKARALFGPDIADLFEKLNKSYAYIQAFGDARQDRVEEYWNNVKFISETASKLPDHFKEYVYFGDYKSE